MPIPPSRDHPTPDPPAPDPTYPSPFSPIDDALAELRAGRMIVLTDDEDRENEGDLILPAQFVSAEAISFMLREAAGYLFITLTEAECDRLGLAPQSAVNTSVRGTPFTVSLDGHPKHGFTTGVSAHERAKCIRMIIDPAFGADDFVRPGHINPLRARDGGVLVRVGHTEGSVDLCRLAGLTPAAVGIEIMRPDGEMARLPDLEQFCAKHGLKMCSIAQLIQHRLVRESLVKRIEPIAGTPIDTPLGTFNLIAFDSVVDAVPQLALTVGGIGDLDASDRVIEHAEPTLVRMHRRNLLGDIFRDLSTVGGSKGERSTGDDLEASLRMIQAEGRGAVVYLRPEGVGDALQQRLTTIRRSAAPRDADAHDLTDPAGVGAQAVPMHHREFGIGGQILRALGLSRLRLLTNRPKEMPGLEAFGLEIAEHVALQ